MKLISIFIILGFIFCLIESKTWNYGKNLILVKPLYACGFKYDETVCKCKDFELNCKKVKFFNADNIRVRNFVVKNAVLEECGISVLKKGQILQGREKEIEMLSFFNNSINYIENGTFDAFTNLKALNLSDNKLQTIHEGILTENVGSNLIELRLGHNEFNGLPATTFKFLSKLEVLDLSKFTGISKEIFSPALRNLKSLYLGFCSITTLDDDFFVNLISLKGLHLYFNPITTVPKAIKFMPNLQELDLGGTRLSTLNKNSFEYSDKMKFLYISECKNLTTIDDCAFCNFPNLQKLEIWFTPNLTNIHENAFGSISSGKLYSKLTDFGISGSNISTLSEKLFDWSEANTLDLSTKGFNCDCSMAWLINDLKRINSVFSKKVHFVQMNGAKGKCKSPPEFKDKHLYAVSGKICNGKLSELYHSSSTTSAVFWIFFFIIIFGIAFICFIFQKQIIKFVHYRIISQQENDNDEYNFFQYSSLKEEDTISASVTVY